MTQSTDDTTDASAAETSTANESTTNPATTDYYDVIVIGGGAAGLSAGVFCARADLDTLVLGHDRSTLRKCAHLENYLGFPEGVRPTTFLELAREHAETAGCRVDQQSVQTVRRADSGSFLVETADDGDHNGNNPIKGDRLLVASWSETEFLDPLGVDTHVEAGHGEVQVIDADPDGRTNVDRLYAAGRITDQHHQAIVNAGHGARIALTLIEDVRPDYYNDWVVPEGYFDHYDRETPPGCEEINHEERERRVRRSKETMQAYFGDDPGEESAAEPPESTADD